MIGRRNSCCRLPRLEKRGRRRGVDKTHEGRSADDVRDRPGGTSSLRSRLRAIRTACTPRDGDVWRAARPRARCRVKTRRWPAHFTNGSPGLPGIEGATRPLPKFFAGPAAAAHGACLVCHPAAARADAAREREEEVRLSADGYAQLRAGDALMLDLLALVGVSASYVIWPRRFRSAGIRAGAEPCRWQPSVCCRARCGLSFVMQLARVRQSRCCDRRLQFLARDTDSLRDGDVVPGTASSARRATRRSETSAPRQSCRATVARAGRCRKAGVVFGSRESGAFRSSAGR